MALLEPKWINVQQKTFTKWYVLSYPHNPASTNDTDTLLLRLNNKVAERQVSVADLVKDLSDGVNPDSSF